MTTDMAKDIARRLRAIRMELGFDQAAMSSWLEIGRTRYVNWEKAENKPSEEAMVLLCDRTGVTLDYIYRGRLDAVQTGLAIRLTAREQGMDPDDPRFDPRDAMSALAQASKRA
jgi:transcriptional regulator with XRE-family HTH domain